MACCLPWWFYLRRTNRTGVGGVKIAEAFPEGRGTGGGGDWPLPAPVALYGIALKGAQQC